MFSKKKGIIRNKSDGSGKKVSLDAWLVALGSQSVYGRIYSLIHTADGLVIGCGSGQGRGGPLWAEAHYL